ncbi:DinB family protein [Mucilaginibacter mali]|uniref:DinB family protein n=1 Tax=Mucilaginibacter mali TaxID=2740462 RepID=A0A7D4Q1A7_9SPHI|nr:DinB family protein [Mucilaginibacter mali]QKJ28827.1 DinB family protein [Mucilaginibacter mali]
MENLLQLQYQNIQGARDALFSYCSNMASAHLFKPVAEFNNNTIVSLMVHSANTYLHWLVFFDTQHPVEYFNDEDIKSIEQIRAIYQKIDEQVAMFLDKYKADYTQPITQYPRSRKALLNTTPLQLFTHVITHEFHHKGQILTMSRLMGYIPADTDVIRT